MAIPSFYHADLAVSDKVIDLDSNESAHAIKSRRLKAGQAIRMFNGSGLVAHGVLSTVGRRNVSVDIESTKQLNRPDRLISVAVTAPKGDRQKVMIDMLTQLGVFEIIPLRCDRSITKFSENLYEKWLRVAIEACKQSQNPWVPIISNEVSFETLLSEVDRQFIFANADGMSALDISQRFNDLTILVGPEGGFSEAEFAKLKQFSIPSLSVGAYILRTETAAIAATSVLFV